MQLNLLQTEQSVTAYDNSSVKINTTCFNYSIFVFPNLPPIAWDITTFDELRVNHFDIITTIEVDIIILGTGHFQHFLHPYFSTTLAKRHIGIESMNNHAACRTYNILIAEKRKVLLALIMNKKEINKRKL